MADTPEEKKGSPQWRKSLAAGISSMFLASGTGQAAGNPALLDGEEKERVNTALVEEMRQDISGVLAGSETSYSRDLNALQQRVTAYLQRNPDTMNRRVIILDPHKMDVGRGLHSPPDATVSFILKDQHGFSPDSESVVGMAQDMSKLRVSRFGVSTYVTAPHAYNFVKSPDTEKVCVIVPASDHAVEIDIPGMTFDQRQTFINLHEAWHCMDSKYRAKSTDKEDYKIDARNPEFLEYTSRNYQREAFADVAALGEMVRAGALPEVIDHVSLWRDARHYDILHFSPPVLEGLKEKIAEMGLEKFRSLDETQARDLYFSVTDARGLSQQSLKVILMYEVASPLQKVGYQIANQSDPETKRALDFLRTVERSIMTSHLPVPLPDADTGIKGHLDAWDAQEELESQAIATAGKITPQSLIRAYEALYNQLRERAKEDDGTGLYPEMMIKLKATFTGAVGTMDYVAANARHGVVIDGWEKEVSQTTVARSLPPPKP